MSQSSIDNIKAAAETMRKSAETVTAAIKDLKTRLSNIPQPERERLQNLIAKVETALKNQDPKALDKIKSQLEKLI